MEGLCSSPKEIIGVGWLDFSVQGYGRDGLTHGAAYGIHIR